MKKLLMLLVILSAVEGRTTAQTPDTAQPTTDTRGIKWTTGLSFAQIKQKAAAENKYIFLDCYATWCGPCKDMDKKIYTNDSVGNYFNQHFINVRVQFDQTKKDNDDTKKWYDDANAIAKQYYIQAFPSFLFLNPQGTITDLKTGYKNASEFVAMAQTAKQPGKTYNSTLDNYNNLVIEYRKGNINYKELPMMIDFATRLDTPLRGELMKTYKEYVIALPAKERYTKENIRFWSSLRLSFQSPLFKFFRNDADNIDRVMDFKGYALYIVDKTIGELIATPFLVDQNTRKEIPMVGMYLSGGGLKADSTEADWKKLHQLISKQFGNKTAKRNVLIAKLEWYTRHLNYYMLCKHRLIQLKNYSSDLIKTPFAFENVNSAAWNAFLYLTDKKMLKEYAKWMCKVVQAKPDGHYFVDTYANLLYKLGRKEEAIVWEEKAVEIAGESDHTNYRESLGQMKRNEPTNIDETVWDGIVTVNWNGVKYSKYVMVKDISGNSIEGISVSNNRSTESKLTNDKGYVLVDVSLGDKLTISNNKYAKQEIQITKDPGMIQIVLKPI